MKRIILTGGGTAGHVTPNLALLPELQRRGWEVFYVGSQNGIEKELVATKKIPYFPIATGKLRRYFSWQNFIDPWKILFGIVQSYLICRKIKPNAIFSKGGFVAFPVVVAAWLCRIPVIAHESDLTIGLANKLSFPFAKKICVTFPETIKHFKDKQKVTVTGTPIRQEFFSGDAAKGREICGFTSDKKILLVFGGSLGAESINVVIRSLLPKILDELQIVHVCGKGKVDESLHFSGYKQFAYLNEEFPHVMAAADLVIARAGANTIYELLVLKKPNILIPLGAATSRGDQIVNAEYCRKEHYSDVILENELTPELLSQKIRLMMQHHQNWINALKNFAVRDSINLIIDLIEQNASK
jgi:UDP-N-acetylglucosamine--N-acetylmuramyl-(pentapeptide) pyrophosphoryl-undecaprenol N-acetylglucosamine transferase